MCVCVCVCGERVMLRPSGRIKVRAAAERKQRRFSAEEPGPTRKVCRQTLAAAVTRAATKVRTPRTHHTGSVGRP